MKLNHRSYLNEYMQYLKLTGRRSQGIKGAKQGVKKFFVYLEEYGLDLKEIGVNEASSYQGWLVTTGRLDGKKYAGNSISHFIVSVSSFFDYLKTENLIHTNPFKEIRRARRELKLPLNILREKELDLLLTELANYESESNLKRKISKYRVHVVAELMYATGMRISEAASLKEDDIDFDAGLVTVIEGKHGRTRVCLLGEYSKSILKTYIDIMRPLVLTEWTLTSDRLFGSGEDCLKKLVNKVLSEACEKLKLPVQTSHGLRHALGFHLLRRGCDIRYIQAILGHKRLKDTEIYTKVEKDDLKEVLEKYHPRQLKRTVYEEAHA